MSISDKFPFCVLGNKQKEMKIIKLYLPTNINKIYEPFGGSFAVSRYYDSQNIETYINDNDVQLYKLLILFKNNLDKVNYIYDFVDNEMERMINEKQKNSDILKSLDSFFITYRYLTGSLASKGIIKHGQWKSYKNHINYLHEYLNKDNVKLFNEDYKKFINDNIDLNDPNVFIFFDPPYFNSYNKSYGDFSYGLFENKKIDITNIYISILELLKNAKCKIMLVINSCEMFKYLFKDYIKLEYKKVYGHAAIKQNHLLITNYDIEK